MGVLFIVSAEEAAGRTAVCAGLAINFLNAGRKVGYFKPAANEPDTDTAFMKNIPGVDIVSEKTFKGHDIVLVETGTDNSASAKKMNARVIAIEVYSDEAPRFPDVYQGFGETLTGVIINKAPQSQLKRIREEAGARCEAAGLKLLGVIPENRVLLAITVGELAESIGGKILNNPEKSGELVENYMLGAMVVGSGLDYFGRKSRKAAIIHHDRPDMQLAALETPTACLVLGGSDQPPVYNVLYKAQTRGIPVIATDAAVNDIVTTIEGTLLNTGLRQSKKLDGLAEAVRQNLDMRALA